MLFQSKKPHFEHLHKKWKSRAKDSGDGLVDKHLRKVALGSLGGLMMLGVPGMGVNHAATVSNNHQVQITGSTNKNILLSKELEKVVPKETRPLTAEEERKVEQLVEENLGIKIKAEIDGKRLNTTYGMIGGEQHLYRYPGDTVYAHAHDATDWAMYGGSGIAPGLGAWGYFAPSKEAFTAEDEANERYYLAVQTFLSPGFSERVAEYRDFYKYRKMLVVNPKTGQTVIADIADAGPAAWTGKTLGGSPEVMHELGLASGPRKGAVLYFFLDDSESNMALGPVKSESEIASR